MIEEAEGTLSYLPPYSPDLNPIEKMWGSIKRKMKDLSSQYSTFSELFDAAHREFLRLV